ncbi:hypothetical protein [Mycolicibacterium tokaiense]|uniref:Conserved PhiRv2-like prophage protein of uncharacterized function (Modular protein) n=1 Tax=Mycolicibacterium tokaiense TaxID=39695 RepID=A0A378TCU7_9MYCO|nr:hypothetical protein [Mycolicibacterium tokaiense]BBY87824.1 hypothetical protein MTOK_36060 [Mycolicibacterium tokaiense]STZ57653.1 Conserved PhiRv2-like prophage protein of uncharacterised function (modular protein) [Mycolicibacterium tokaiense]
MTAYETIVGRLSDDGRKVVEKADGHAQAECPAHDDHNPSLSIAPRKDGRGVVICCHAGCDYLDVLDALDLSPRDLFDDESLQRVYSPRRTYDYPDGRKVHRKPGKSFPQIVPTVRNPDGHSLFHADRVGGATTVYWPEGEKDVEAIEALGAAAVCSPMGAGKAHRADVAPLQGRHVIVVADRDGPGRKHADQVVALLTGVAGSVTVVEAKVGKDAADHIAAGLGLDDLVPVAAGSPPALATLEDAHAVFKRWFGDDYDTDALDAVLATAAVERLDGDPLWMLLISGSGNAKTETVQCLDGIDAIVTSTISSCGALLSATAKKERAKDATGGLLRKLEPRGVMVVKDVTSILSMSGDAKAEVLGALREVYDGRWSRNVGTDGGRTLEWAGRIAVIGAVTTVWDRAHSVIASMGDRFVLMRMDSTTGRQAAGRQAIGNTGSEVQMRAELSAAAAGVIAGMDTTTIEISDVESDVLLAAADLVTRARTGVDYDYRGDVIDAHAPEMPTRFAKQLAQVVRGAVAIGIDRPAALRLAIRCARDSMPPLRLAIIDDIAAHPNGSTAEVRKRLGKPRATVDRQLQALHMLDVLKCDEESITWGGKDATRWTYRLADGIEPTALDPKSVPDLASRTPTPHRSMGGQTDEPSDLHAPPAKSGTDRCVDCGTPLTVPESVARQRCRECAFDG